MIQAITEGFGYVIGGGLALIALFVVCILISKLDP